MITMENHPEILTPEQWLAIQFGFTGTAALLAAEEIAAFVDQEEQNADQSD